MFSLRKPAKDPFCSGCGCRMQEAVIVKSNVSFDTKTGQGLERRRKVWGCSSNSDEYDGGIYRVYGHDWFEFGATYSVAVTGDCASGPDFEDR